MRRKRRWLIPISVIAVLAAVFFLYTADYYRAGPTALAALDSGEGVSVVPTDYGWLFDGPSQDTALIFYPGAKVEETAYAPFLAQLAGNGMDVCLVKMPFHLAVFGINKADGVMGEYSYSRWFVGGHSLGGAMAAEYAAGHADGLAGVILCAAYPTKPLDDRLIEISVYGSEDLVLNREKAAAGAAFAPDAFFEREIQGGNHAQFGDYGPQKGDGTASVSPREQQSAAAEFIVSSIGE